MKSRLYYGRVMHARLNPVKHHFVYPMYMYALDLSELEEIDRAIPLFGYNRFRPAALYDRDYLDKREGSILEKLMSFLRRHGCADGIDRIELLTSARYFNYIFNPVSFYYCYASDDELRCAVAEVNNTFRERHLYILDHPLLDHPAENSKPRFTRYTVPKEFHVSPFNDMLGDYDFRFSKLNQKMEIRLDIRREGKAAFKTRLWGESVPLTRTNLRRTLMRYPITAWLTMPRILWQAAILYSRKKMTIYTKPNPTNPMTIRAVPALWEEKVYMAMVSQYLSCIEHGSLTLVLPDQTTRHFGEPSSEPREEMRIRNYDFFRRVVRSGDIGFGESYTAGDWDADDLTGIIQFFIKNREALNRFVVRWAKVGRLINRLKHALRKNTLIGSRKNIHDHYDLSNDFFQTFLDPSMTYSCALFNNPGETLQQGQINKLNAIIQKAQIQSSDHVLEIGSGWGSFAIQAAQQTGCRVTTITLSEEQKKLAEERILQAGLQDRIEVRLCDYRSMEGVFDKIASIEMIESVGHEYLGAYFAALDRLLKPCGLAVIQAITIPDQHYDIYRQEGDWLQKHIFPGAVVPSLSAMCDGMKRHSRLLIHDLENFGIHYARTLREWRQNLFAHRSRVEALGFDETFMRTWNYYFSYCEAGFATRTLNDLQLVLTRPNNPTIQ